MFEFQFGPMQLFNKPSAALENHFYSDASFASFIVDTCGQFICRIKIHKPGYSGLIIAVVTAVISCVGSCTLIAANSNWNVNCEPDGSNAR